MPRAIRCPGAEAGTGSWRGRPLAILLGWNLPALLWLGYALAKPLLFGSAPGGGLWCPTCALLGWCPACGTTGTLGRWLFDGAAPDLFTGLLMLGFAINAGWSLVRANQARWASP